MGRKRWVLGIVSIRTCVCILFILYLTLSFSIAQGQELHPRVQPERSFDEPSLQPQPLRFGTRLSLQQTHTLPPLSQDERRRIHESPMAIGVVRNLPTSLSISNLTQRALAAQPLSIGGGLLIKTDDEKLVWTARIISPGANALRIFISQGYSPKGTSVFIYNDKGEVYGPYLFDRPVSEGGFWTHTIFSDNAYVEVQISGVALDSQQTFQLIIPQFLHIEHLSIDLNQQLQCLEDVNCSYANSFNGIGNLRSATAAIGYIGYGGLGLVFSGALLNNARNDIQPFLLTANHGIWTQAQAQSAEFWFDYRTTSCNGSINPNAYRLLGATLCATNSATDFTLLLLREEPYPTQVHLGWTTASISSGTVLHSVHHPYPGLGPRVPQKYTRSEKRTFLVPSYDYPLTRYHYERILGGATLRGSSGAAIVNSNSQVVGQHAGKIPVWFSYDDCSFSTYWNVSGKFEKSYINNNLSYWLVSGANASISASTSSLNLGSVIVGSSAELTITVTNTSAYSNGLNLKTHGSITGTNKNQFSILVSPYRFTPPTHKATYTIRFSPTSSGSKSATLTITHNGSYTSSPINISLTGTATVNPPLTPTANAASNVTTSSFTANWNSVSGATGYRLDVATNSSFTNYVSGYQNFDVGNVTSRNITGLSAGTTYYYRVRAYNNGGTSDNSNTISVTTTQTLTISGHVRTSEETGISGVTMSGLPGNPSTDEDGYYAGTVDYGWSGTVTPTKEGYTFSPSSRAYTHVASDITGENYVGTLVPYEISGHVRDSGNVGIEDVIMSYGDPETIDQKQEELASVIWYAIERWQEFRPTGNKLCKVDISIYKAGSPSNLILYIKNIDGHSLWNNIIDGSQVPQGDSWVSVPVEPALDLIPEETYRIHVTSSFKSPDRYFWIGKTDSLYNRGVSSIGADFDFAFRTYSGDVSIFTDAQGYYRIYASPGWTGTVTPEKEGYSFEPVSKEHSNIISDQTNQDYTATLLTYTTISGAVRIRGEPLEGVVMNGLPGDPTTDSSGSYSAIVNFGWSGTVTPSKEGYKFSPESRTYTDVTSDQVDQDYTATLMTYTISGAVRIGGSGLSGVVMDGLPGDPTTDASGSYSATVEYSWSGTAMPHKERYTFSPISRDYTNVTTDQSDQDYIATLIQYTLTINASTGGTTDPSPGDYTYDHGTQVNITATPSSGYRFSGWTGNVPSGHENDNPITITMDSDKSVTANFIHQYTLTIAAGTGGTTDPVPGSYTHDSGTEVNITAIPDANYRFSDWTGDVPSGHENDNPITITMDSDKSIEANFIRQYRLTIGAGTGGTTEPSSGSYIYDVGTQVSVRAISNSGYKFSNWSGDASGTTNPITITMDSDKSIIASFVKKEAPAEKKGGCFIATATYGSPLHSYVKILRDFRDKYLIPTKFGHLLVEFYYKNSPFFADLIAKHKVLKIVVRINLLPLVAFSYLMLHFGPAITTFFLVFIFMLPKFFVLFYRRRTK